MSPIQFPEQNTVMRRPRSMTEAECADVHAFRDDKWVVTAWRPSPEEITKINLGQPVYLCLVGSMPPALVTADNPFLSPNESMR